MREKRRRSEVGAARPGRWVLHLRPVHGVCFALALLASAGFGFVLARAGSRAAVAPPRAAGSSSVPAPPWGQLEYTLLELERPDESLSRQRLELPLPAWRFDNLTEAQVEALLSAEDLTPAQRKVLTNRAHWSALTNGWVVQPTAEVVRSLSPAARARLYGLLFKDPQNRTRGRPFRIPADRFENWLASSGLPPGHQGLLRSLTYRQDDHVYFADLELLEAQCTLEQQQRLAKALSRSTTLLMRLRVTPQSDLDALLRYWSRYRSPWVVKPFLQSLAQVPEGSALHVAFFFPPFARQRLYTYPDLVTDPNAPLEDCYWTALNFANERPDPRFHDQAVIQSTLRTAYAEVPPPWEFGDLILLLEEGQLAIHLCVYVADEVVFTKNGTDVLRPWVLMKLSDVVREYRALKGKPVEAVGLRRKPPGSS